MKDEIIVKNSLRLDSTGKIPFSRILGLFALAALCVLSVVGMLFDGWAHLTGVVVGGGFLCYTVFGVVQGRVIAVISEEGLALRKQSFAVIPWGNIRAFTNRIGRRGNKNSSIDVRFNDEFGNMHIVYFNMTYTNYSVIEALEIMDRFSDKYKSSDGKNVVT